jgi:hypothetical protein
VVELSSNERKHGNTSYLHIYNVTKPLLLFYTPDDGSVIAETCRVDLIKSHIYCEWWLLYSLLIYYAIGCTHKSFLKALTNNAQAVTVSV